MIHGKTEVSLHYGDTWDVGCPNNVGTTLCYYKISLSNKALIDCIWHIKTLIYCFYVFCRDPEKDDPEAYIQFRTKLGEIFWKPKFYFLSLLTNLEHVLHILTLEVTYGNSYGAHNLKLVTYTSLKNYYIANDYPRNINEISLFCLKDPLYHIIKK